MNNTEPPAPAGPGLHWPSLLLGLGVMLVGSIYPIAFAGADGKADHQLALLVFWAMGAGLIRGVGYIPHRRVWRWLFSGWACGLAAGLALAYKLLV